MRTKEKLRIAYEAGAKSVQTNIEINKLLEMGTKQCPEEATFETFLANKNAVLPVGKSFEQEIVSAPSVIEVTENLLIDICKKVEVYIQSHEYYKGCVSSGSYASRFYKLTPEILSLISPLLESSPIDKEEECEDSCQFYGLNKRGVCCKTWRKFEEKIISDEAITEKANKMEAGTSWCHAYSFEEGAKWHRSILNDNNPKN